MTNKHIVVDEEYKKRISQLAKDFDINEKQLVQSMADYFFNTGIDPRKSTRESFNTAIKKLEKSIKETDNRIISFIKQQEKTQLKQIIENLEVLVKKQYDYSKGFENFGDTLEKFDKSYIELLTKINTNQKSLNENIKAIANKIK
jgi:molecular chaperone DnaK (HSP70)